METYYKAQNILPDAEEFQAYLDAMKKALPLTFRITGSHDSAVLMRDYMKSVLFPYLSGKTFEGMPLRAPQPIHWYPDSLAYMLDIPKQAIRKNPEFKAFQKFLVMESDSGNIVRQELVSMIPPLLMNIKEDSKCFDMCAAPGSKTSQMVEYLHSSGNQNPPGFVLANDSDFKRAYMLVHQVKRLNSPNFIVTNHDATFIPNFHNAANKTVQKFDRVLADVPCSGDGTLRKNLDIWAKWTVTGGLSLHSTQINCLRRGLQMLEVGGRLVYSTCSLNPIENEAVLTAVLSTLDGAAHLVDVSSELPGLKRRPGLHTWKVTDFKGNFVENIVDVKEDRHKFPITAFPPSIEEAQSLHLERCIRVYPHLQDTGGFFVAVIDKTREFTGDVDVVRNAKRKRGVVENKSPQSRVKKAAKVDTAEPPAVFSGMTVDEMPGPEPQVEAKPTSTTGAAPSTSEAQDVSSDAPAALPDHEVEQVIGKPKFMKSLNDEYFKFLEPDHPELLEIAAAYGFSKYLAMDCFLSRNISGEPVRALYYTSPMIKKLLIHNENRVKFVHAGIKVFHKQTVDHLQDGSSESEGICKWRIVQDGVELLKDAIDSHRVVHCNIKELSIFMHHEFPRPCLFKDEEGSVTRQMAGKKYGCYILRCNLRNEPTSKVPEIICLPLWKSRHTIQMMLARKDKEAIYTRVTGESLPAAVKMEPKKSAENGTQATNEAEVIDAENVNEIIEQEDLVEVANIAVSDAIAEEEEGLATASTLQT